MESLRFNGKGGKMAYVAKDFSKLIGMQGFSETLLKNHFTLYQGYVNNTNKLVVMLAGKVRDGMNPEYAELKRRFGFEFDGMKLHELYFENLGGKTQLDRNGKLALALTESFGSFEEWEKDFKATGGMRGIGWVVLYEDHSAGGALFNVWVNEHQTNQLVGCTPILVIDVWEHAYMTDYGLKKADYIEAFFKNVNWEAVAKRLA